MFVYMKLDHNSHSIHITVFVAVILNILYFHNVHVRLIY